MAGTDPNHWTTRPAQNMGLWKRVKHHYLYILHSKFNLLMLQLVLSLTMHDWNIFLFISYELKLIWKEISFFLRGRMARGAAPSKKKFPFWWALAHQKWNFVQIFLRGCALVLKNAWGAEMLFVHSYPQLGAQENCSNDFSQNCYTSSKLPEKLLFLVVDSAEWIIFELFGSKVPKKWLFFKKIFKNFWNFFWW